MANQCKQPLSLIMLLSFITIAISISFTEADGLGGGGAVGVGGRWKIEDVESNKEVQALGKYSVREYNRVQHHKRKAKNGAAFRFLKVVEAEEQVVAGIKYYLTVSATTSDGVPKRFEAVVVVQPWKKSKDLLGFHPSPATK